MNQGNNDASEFILVGIDVSKHRLDVYIRPTEEAFQHPNTDQGIGELVQRLQQVQPELVVVEVTGGMGWKSPQQSL